MAFLRHSVCTLLFWSLAVSYLVVASPQCATHNETFVPDAVLRVTESNISQSCYPSKATVLVNGTSPGPELRIKEGITYWIRAYNDMQDKNLTMHWHGLTQAMAPFADGTPQASQWPIPPLYFFDYEIHVPIGMAGTYFYHSHVGFQAVSGTGPLIVEEHGASPYHYDEDKIVFLQDVFVKDESTIEAGLVASPLSWSGESAMVLVNGKGGGSANGTACNASLSTIEVEPGKTYRLRFIGGTALTFASLAFEDHDLEIIEADGHYTQPYNTSYLQIGTGQRFSALLRTRPNPEKSTYYLQVESRERPTLTRGFAVLNYGLKPTIPFLPPNDLPLTLPNTTRGFLDYELHPLSPPKDFPTAEEVTRRITMTVHQRVLGPTIWVQNDYPWTETFPQEPYLVSLYNNNSLEFPSMERALANDGIDPISRAFPAQIGEVLEIVIQNTGADKGGLDVHPFHAHGAHYWDLGSGNRTYDQASNEVKIQEHGHPIQRDTTMLYRYATTTTNGTNMGWRAWRIRVTEPGVWMIHCHILQHMIMGMQTIWVFGNETEVLGKVGVPEVQGYLTYGGSVYGNENRWPSVVHFTDNEGSDAWTDNQ
ncbi:Multicopper oxidase aurL2 [Lachnellula suecica]|uniref:Multicopper oxidase aurL2 n=1 Tax=Lachnellula suecica TaxID=602035 RepID=A0A8T9CHC8_9HELO|nr:Multicopper oxidase aurL2 [Lachnellula suecica]